MNASDSRRRTLVFLLLACVGCSQGPKPAATSADPPAVVEVRSARAVAPAESEIEAVSAKNREPQPPSLDDLIQPSVPEKSAPPSLHELRLQRDATVWQAEVAAQQYEQVLVRLWDGLLEEQRKPDGDPYSVLSGVQMESIRVASAAGEQPIRWGATVASLNQHPRDVAQAAWPEFVAWFRRAGYRIVQTEWHHARFEPSSGGTAKSTVAMAIYAVHPDRDMRYVLSGDLVVNWRARSDSDDLPTPATLDATHLKLYSRAGPPAFAEILTIDHATPASRSGVQPVLLHDVDEDGLSEMLLGGSNELFWNRGHGNFERDALLAFPEKGFEAGLVADVTGDSIADYLSPGIAGDLLMYEGDQEGRFRSPPKGKARGGGPLRQPQVIAAGDVDRDGDVDLWIGQYKISYVGGQMPTPYYDANDGFPAFLLTNDGQGKFTPQTEEAGLAEKRRRRSYGGSFVDLDQDGDLDLLVVSDFAGVDVYFNDGRGRFMDVTDAAVDERHLFGMSATFADYNADGRLDFFVAGMASTTARRLEQMRLGRSDRPEIHEMRPRMGYGNRMYLGQVDQRTFAQPAFKDDVARTGWTWGSTSLDFDNDGYPDIFVANGHASGASTKDHCSHFWCHDIYDGGSKPNVEVLEVFNDVMQGYYDRSESWDGYQKNQLLMNLDGQGFVNVGFLMGVGHEYDGRAVVSDDLDADGRLDLIVVEDRWQSGQLLHVYRNQLATNNHWIGVRLVDRPGSDSPLGASVVLVRADGRRRISCVTAGDSIHAQHASTVHFGLGQEQDVKSIEVRLTSGRTLTLPEPKIDRYHLVEVD